MEEKANHPPGPPPTLSIDLYRIVRKDDAVWIVDQQDFAIMGPFESEWEAYDAFEDRQSRPA